VRERAHGLEQIAHGRASGIDDAVIAWERPLVFDPSTPRSEPSDFDPRIIWLDADEGATPPLWIAWTRRERSTRAAVAAVSALKETDPESFDEACRRAAIAVEGCLDALGARDWSLLSLHLSAAHQALAAVGVVTPTHEAMRKTALEAGAWSAKTTGAGCGGAMLILGPPSLDLKTLMNIDGVEGCFFAGGVA
jgi:mevalonate kinase